MFGQVSDEVRKFVDYLVRPTDLEGAARLEAIAEHTGKDVRALRLILEDLEREDKRCVRGLAFSSAMATAQTCTFLNYHLPRAIYE